MSQLQQPATITSAATMSTLTTSMTTTSAAINHSTPTDAGKTVLSRASSTAQTSILSIVFAGWVTFALIIAIVIARRRGKLRRSGRASASVSALGDIEQQIGAPASLGITTLGMHHQHPKPARIVLNKAELHLLPTKPYAEYLSTDSTDSKGSKGSNIQLAAETCAICLDNFSEKSMIRVLACNHIFHPTCVDRWLLKRSCRCPLCNSDTRGPLGLPQRPSIVKLSL